MTATRHGIEVNYFLPDDRLHHVQAHVGIDFVSKKQTNSKRAECYVLTEGTTPAELVVPISQGSIFHNYRSNHLIHLESGKSLMKLNLHVCLHEIKGER